MVIHSGGDEGRKHNENITEEMKSLHHLYEYLLDIYLPWYFMYLIRQVWGDHG